MNIKTLTELDYFRVRDIISGYCVSEEGALSLKNRTPLADAEKINTLKLYGREWYSYLASAKQAAMSQWNPVSEILPVINTPGAAVTQEQAFSLLQFCEAQKKVKSAIESAKDVLNLENLSELVQTLPDLSAPHSQISSVIDLTGELKDLPCLRSIRARISSFKREINNLMKKYTSDPNLSGALESNVPAFRANRQVLAVKSGRRSAVKGIIHEMSQSGQTVYIEPEDVVRKNNDLIQEEFNLQAEIKRIFRELTAGLMPHASSFMLALPIMLELDISCAAAKWGKENRCRYAADCAKDGGEPPLILKARHPILGEKAVPIDVRFMGGKRVLIITGPNTGGKTVTLKTIALFAMLNQSGFPVPAEEGTRLPIFSNVFADIGDSQSLDQSLSTFSGHMKNIAESLEGAGSNSLILLDELGSGTDPLEGGAIAMAVLDALIEKDSFVLVTTHHGILKNYGYTHPSCVNASVEFDPNTLSPTYRLIMGVPGESRALDIASRSGLGEKVCKKARSYIANESSDVSSLIKGLIAKHTELENIYKDLNDKKCELVEQKRKASLHELKLRQKEAELKKEGYKESQKFLSESRKKLENLVREIKEGEITRGKTLSVKSFINDLETNVYAQEQSIESDEKELSQNLAPAESPSLEEFRAAQKDMAAQKLEFKSGAKVSVKNIKQPGILVHEERKGTWSVQMGNVKMNIKQKDLTLIPPDEDVKTQLPSITVDLADNTKNGAGGVYFKGGKPQFELRLLGLYTDEALKLLERQLDLCTVHNFNRFSIIHGKGSGALQQAVQDYLSHYPGIANFYFAPPEEGGTGKTYVEMAK
ncbi:endonuclease MutS2 [Treponema parvum]|uniref:Endonuclease MutS2 n=1 Tax=Treponema parvum TaxID=138851 RepID=A0A975F0L8_9SPIR|nr:endonuclease MutS2 [Treponema parvum]QTQ12242.1 endonuclease MutS2 [Treponema parvum]